MKVLLGEAPLFNHPDPRATILTVVGVFRRIRQTKFQSYLVKVVKSDRNKCSNVKMKA